MIKYQCSIGLRNYICSPRVVVRLFKFCENEIDKLLVCTGGISVPKYEVLYVYLDN